ncbi:MAG: hypothetical protein MR328_03340, partial [Firmicutes bacterium]|nr:hypothetical protein [Bacillota bacterium]
MKKGRRLLAILMAVCLVCAYMPASAFGVEGMKLKFSATELAHGSVSYKIGDADYVDVDEATKDASGAIWIDLSSDSKGKMIYIKVTPEDSFAVNNIVAKEGDADSANPAYGGNFDKETGVYSFVLDSVIYPVEIGISKVDESSGDNPGGGESGNNPEGGNQPPVHHGDAGYISFDVRGTDGSISYQCADSKENLSEEGWQSVSTENDWYVPIAKGLFGSTYKVFFRIKGDNSKHLDVDGAFRILDENHQCKYTVLGTYNDDPEYDSNNNGTQPSERIGLKDMYDNTNDYYIIPVDRSWLIDNNIRFVEFRWIDVMPISVEIDEASQYMIANGKTEIGIASGKGFGISVQNGSNVSIPLLEDTDLEGKEERYLIDLKVNRNYFIPELSINGNVYQTFDTGGGGDGYTNIAVAVPAKEFKSIVAESKGSIVIHLTVDKNVSVENQDVQASFNMISNGTIPDGVSMENLDANVVLSATDSTLTEDEIAEGAARAFDITMSVESKPETEFIVPIDISIDGNFSGDENNYSVIREHEGETPQVLECHVEKGEDNDILTFSTSKFSKFTIVYKENSSNSSGGITVIPSLPSDNDITNSGSGADASTSVDVSDKT